MNEEDKEEVEEKEYDIEDCEKNSHNREFFDQAINDKATWVIAYADDVIKADKELILKCAKIDGQVLYYASENLRDDKEVVLAAVSQKPLIVKYASRRLRADIDVAKATLEHALKDRYFSEIKSYLEPEVYENEEIKKILNPEE